MTTHATATAGRDATATERAVAHGSLTLERTYPHAPAAVFAAWTVPDLKKAWFGQGPDFVEKIESYELDFRVGGHERWHGPLRSGRSFRYDATFFDVIQDRRIVAAYDLLIADRRLSVTLLTVELRPAGTGAHLSLTEQIAFLDGLDSIDDRRPGVEDMLDMLDAYMATIGV